MNHRPEAVPILCKVYEKVDGENMYSSLSAVFFVVAGDLSLL